MKAAFAVWNNRIAPVLDVARVVHLVEAESRRILIETDESLPGDPDPEKALRLTELGVDVLVCGAISRPMLAAIAAHGREVIQAWLSGALEKEVFAMPGCRGRGRGRGFLGPNDLISEEYPMREGNRGGMGQRGGQGGGGRGRMGGPLAGGPTGFCVCPQCGHKEAHQRGTPCNQRNCANCGSVMARE